MHHLRHSSSVCEAGNRRGGGGGVGRLGRLVRLDGKTDGPCVAVKPTYLRLERRAMRERERRLDPRTTDTQGRYIRHKGDGRPVTPPTENVTDVKKESVCLVQEESEEGVMR